MIGSTDMTLILQFIAKINKYYICSEEFPTGNIVLCGTTIDPLG